MIDTYEFFEFLLENEIDFFAGVPDSLLKSFSACINDHTEIGHNHFITPNEGLAVSLASGYYLSSGKVPLVYMQNSGLGNIVNPVTSLTSEKLFGIPILYVIGWRGQPGQKDEPQHVKQGEITPDLLELVGIPNFIINNNKSMNDIKQIIDTYLKNVVNHGKSIALIFEKNTLSEYSSSKYQNDYQLNREKVVHTILKMLSAHDIVVSTTGKISREVYDFREQNKNSHHQDFLTIGSMGHASMIALGIAVNQPHRMVWCLDGDGAAIMHMGSLALIGSTESKNLVHIILNNAAYESVGGQPTPTNKIDFRNLALSCGYKMAFMINSLEDLIQTIELIKISSGPFLIDIHIRIGSRKDLSRPTKKPALTKKDFMDFINETLSMII